MNRLILTPIVENCFGWQIYCNLFIVYAFIIGSLSLSYMNSIHTAELYMMILVFSEYFRHILCSLGNVESAYTSKSQSFPTMKRRYFAKNLLFSMLILA